MDFEIEKLVGYILTAIFAAMWGHYTKMRRDITAAHRKIRKIQKHLKLDENGDCGND